MKTIVTFSNGKCLTTHCTSSAELGDCTPEEAAMWQREVRAIEAKRASKKKCFKKDFELIGVRTFDADLALDRKKRDGCKQGFANKDSLKYEARRGNPAITMNPGLLSTG